MNVPYNPAGLPQSVITIGPVCRQMREGIGMNVFLGRDRYYPPVSDTARWAEIGALMDEARPGFLRIGYLEGTGVAGDVTPWDDVRQAFDPSDWAGVRFERAVVDEMRKGVVLPPVTVPDGDDPYCDLMITPYSITTLTEVTA